MTSRKPITKYFGKYFNIEAIERKPKNEYSARIEFDNNPECPMSGNKKSKKKSKNTFVFVGDCFLPGNSPCKGYIRSKVQLIFVRMDRRRGCTVVGVDEFRTTKLCSFCFRELEQPTKNGRVQKKYRYYKCRGCVTVPEATEAMDRNHSRKTNRLLTKQRQTVPRPGVRISSKFRRYEKRPANERNITWNCDVNAGRNILYRGWCAVMDVELHQALKREEEEAGGAPTNQIQQLIQGT